MGSRNRPLDAPLHAHNLHAIDSSHRLNRSDSANNFTVRLASAVGQHVQRNVALRSAVIPNRFVNISAFADDRVRHATTGASYRANNTLEFAVGAATATFTVREGHYETTADSPLLTALNKLMVSASVAAEAGQSAIFTHSGTLALATLFQASASAYATVDQATGVLRLNWNSAATVVVKNTRLARDLGLYASSTATEISTPPHNATIPFIGVLVPNLPDVTHVNVQLEELETNYYCTAPDQREEEEGVVRIRDLHLTTIACIPITSAFGEDQHYNPVDLEWVEIGKAVPQLHFTLTDQKGNPLRMPINWNCILVFEKAHSVRQHDRH